MVMRKEQKDLLKLAIERYCDDSQIEKLPDSIYNLIVDSLKLKPGMTLMDMGCGDGTMLVKVLKDNKEVRGIGIDVSRFFLEELTLEFSDRRYKGMGSIRPVTYFSTGTPEGTVDRVLYSNSLRYAAECDLAAVWDELVKITSNEAICVLYDYFSILEVAIRESDGTVYHSYSKIISDMNDRNFKLVKLDTTSTHGPLIHRKIMVFKREWK